MAKKLAKMMTTRTITARTIVHFEREMEIPANISENDLSWLIAMKFDVDDPEWEIMECDHDVVEGQ